MENVVLGRTGLEVSVAGLGCGGHSRLGRATGATEEESVRLVQRALELGVTYIDTARAYGTEEIVGRGLAGSATRWSYRPRLIPRAAEHPSLRERCESPSSSHSVACGLIGSTFFTCTVSMLASTGTAWTSLFPSYSAYVPKVPCGSWPYPSVSVPTPNTPCCSEPFSTTAGTW